MLQAQTVKAVYSDGVLRLLEPIDLPEGAQVQVQVEPLSQETTEGNRVQVRYLYPTRPQPPASLERLVGLIQVGGDAVADSESLYDADWN